MFRTCNKICRGFKRETLMGFAQFDFKKVIENMERLSPDISRYISKQLTEENFERLTISFNEGEPNYECLEPAPQTHITINYYADRTEYIERYYDMGKGKFIVENEDGTRYEVFFSLSKEEMERGCPPYWSMKVYCAKDRLYSPDVHTLREDLIERNKENIISSTIDHLKTSGVIRDA